MTFLQRAAVDAAARACLKCCTIRIQGYLCMPHFRFSGLSFDALMSWLTKLPVDTRRSRQRSGVHNFTLMKEQSRLDFKKRY